MSTNHIYFGSCNASIGNVTNNVYFPGNENSPLFKPVVWCARQWTNWAKFSENESKIESLLKKMIIFVPLVFATLASAL